MGKGEVQRGDGPLFVFLCPFQHQAQLTSLLILKALSIPVRYG